MEDNRHLDAKLTTVYLKAGSYSFLTKDTLFDCNSVHCINISALDFSHDNVKMIYDGCLKREDIDEMIAATLASPVVERYIKNSIRCDE